MKYLFLILFSLFSSISIGQDSYYFVSPNGDDNNSGNYEDPLATIQMAIKKSNKEKIGNDFINIILREGIYEIKNTIVLQRNNPLLNIMGQEGEQVILTGGKHLDISKIKSVKDTEYENIFKKEKLENIYMIDLKEQGITDYGKIKTKGFPREYKTAPMELFINGNPFELARWPNDSSFQITDLIDPGTTHKDPTSRGGKIKHQVDIPLWKNTDDIWIEGYFHYGYALDAVHVKEWDFKNKTITTTQPHTYGFASGHDWNKIYAYNIPEEIDQEGEYYIDRKNGILFFYSKEEIKSLEVSLLESPFFSIENANFIHIDNITFQTSRGIGMYIENSNSIHIDNCTFKNLGSLAIWTEKQFNTNINEEENILGNHFKKNKSAESKGSISQQYLISNCKIFNTGAGGIRLHGGNRTTLEASNHNITNCEIHNYNRLEKSYRPAIRISGVGNTISHCKIHNGMNQAILLQGNDHVIEYNDIHDVCLDVDDAGALYYGRNPSERGHIVRHNYFHHISGDNDYQTSAIYHDDGACGMEVYGNIFLNAGSIAVFIGGGSDNSYRNNLFLDCTIGMHIDDRLNNWNSKFIKPNGLFHDLLNRINYQSPPYSTQYPYLAKYWEENPAIPKRNIVEQNIFCEIGILFATGNKLLDWNENTNILTSGYPNLWKKDIDKRDFMPNDMYLPRPPEWKELEKDKMGILLKDNNVLTPR